MALGKMELGKLSWHHFWLHDNLPNSILPNAILPYAILPNLPFYPMPFYPMPFYQIPTYPMLFDLFVQLSGYKLAVAIRRIIWNICGQNSPMFGCDSFISSPTGHLFYSRLNSRSG